MAKIEITYKNKVCKLEKEIGDLQFYSYNREEENDVENLLVVDKQTKDVLANVSPCLGEGAYGSLYWDGFDINNE